MKVLKNIFFFTTQNVRYLKKKWSSLLLLFIMPICMISLIILLILQFMMPSEQQKSTLAIVDNDRTEETKVLTQLLVMALKGNDYIEIERMSEKEAQQAMKERRITSYVQFPTGLTNDLYAGNPIALPLVGNPNKPIENAMIKNLLHSMSSYIESAQASILTVYEYAQETSISKEKYRQLQEEIFIEYAIFTLGKNNLLVQNTINNIATSKPVYYYTISTLFICLTVWLVGFHMLLMKEETLSIQKRLQMFGVTVAQGFIAKGIVAIVGSLVFLIVLYSVANYWLELALYPLDYMRLLLFVLFYCICFTYLLGLVELICHDAKARLMLQIALVVFVILISGAVLPIIYFPYALQHFITYTFPYEAFSWMIDIALENRNYANYSSLAIFAAVSAILYHLLARLLERRQR
ncbi:ABC transporter permease [Metasolibacillus fluoroglycofenilyticus]|uniref:ABC transporter permease n=1 Tax=Metasolibacillus fluoroglycofenilyticus TaxID=1239396 RepID=UPI000D33C4A8|nr:ABC transporter permease [Metasolibacillus fluoroglycofenilyticus]